MEFFMFVLYFVCVVVFFALWVIAWISISFKLDRVNKNLEEVKELLSEKLATKKSKKQWGSASIWGGYKRRIMYIMYSLSCWCM